MKLCLHKITDTLVISGADKTIQDNDDNTAIYYHISSPFEFEQFNKDPFKVIEEYNKVIDLLKF